MILSTQKPRVFGSSYYPPESVFRDRPISTQPHRHRDVHVLLDALPTLQSLGYEWSGVIANVAPGVLARMAPEERLDVDPPLESGDLVFLLGRPPLDDESNRWGRPKRYTPRSDTPLEREIHQALRSVIRHCDREHLILALQLPDAARCFEHVIFFVTKGGASSAWGRSAPPLALRPTRDSPSYT